MSDATYGTAVSAFASTGRDHKPSNDILIWLLTSAIEDDVSAAKVCIERAAEVLQIRPDDDTPKAARPPVARGGLAPWQAKRLAAHIDANLASCIRTEELAEIAHLSPSHFFRVFRESFGVTPLAYVARQRMRRAQQLMLNSREPLAQIALDCGMCDQAHFTRVFRRVVGVNPRAWRRQFATRAA